MKILHITIAVLINLIWGSMFVAAAIGLEEFPPILFTGIRFLLLALCLSMFIRVPVDLVKPLLLIGLLMGAGMYLTLYLSIAIADNTASVAIFSKLEVPFRHYPRRRVIKGENWNKKSVGGRCGDVRRRYY